jgi:hypothetical protein
MDPVSLMLSAQRQPKGPPPEAAAAAFGLVAVYICVVAFAVIVGGALQIWWYITAYKALSAVSPRNRDMEPAMIFLRLIPCFGSIWYFFIVIRIASSLKKEFDDRGLREDSDFGQIIGILMPLIPCANIVLFFMWVLKIRGFTARLERSNSRRSGDDD